MIVQDPHLRLHWWSCYHCHLEEGWGCDNSQCYLPADQDSSGSCCVYLPDSTHHWLISGSKWHGEDIQLHSEECQGKIIKDSAYLWQWWPNPICGLLDMLRTIVLWNSTHPWISAQPLQFICYVMYITCIYQLISTSGYPFTPSLKERPTPTMSCQILFKWAPTLEPASHNW